MFFGLDTIIRVSDRLERVQRPLMEPTSSAHMPKILTCCSEEGFVQAVRAALRMEDDGERNFVSKGIL